MAPLPCPRDDTCILYLVRHGATANNMARPPRLQGRRENPGLSDEGQRQARAVAELLAERPITAVYCSPLLRARETSEIIAATHKLTPTTVDDLIEVDVGHWEGRDWGEIERSEPDAYRRFIEDPAAHPYAGGESLSALAARVLPAVDELLQRHLGQAIAVVGHNVVNRVYLATLMQLPLSRARSIAQENCGVNVIRRRAEIDSLITSNAVFHLGQL